jgi:hypothetical protein
MPNYSFAQIPAVSMTFFHACVVIPRLGRSSDVSQALFNVGRSAHHLYPLIKVVTDQRKSNVFNWCRKSTGGIEELASVVILLVYSTVRVFC